MAKKNWLLGIPVTALVLVLVLAGCPSPGDDPDPEPDKTIASVTITGNKKGGSIVTANAKTASGSGITATYQWKRSDSDDGSYTAINGATEDRYTIVSSDKYLKVEATNSSTSGSVSSAAFGPIDANQTAKPTAKPSETEVVSGQEITLASATESVTIYYTLDGSTPTKDSERYSSYPGLKITASCTLKAIAVTSGMIDSEVLSVTYTVTPTPSWTSVTSPAFLTGGGANSVAYGNGVFVAGGARGAAYSSNGSTWTAVASGGDNPSSIYSLAYGDKFVAFNNTLGDYEVYTSSNGSTWTKTDTTLTQKPSAIAYGGEKYVAVGFNGAIAYSTNGTAWTSVTPGTTQFGTSDTIYGVAYGAGKFVAVGASGKMAYSTDGATWTAVSTTTFTSTISGITYGGPSGSEKFIAIGNGLSSTYLAYSTDGTTWTQIDLPYSVSGAMSGLVSSFEGIIWGGNKFVAFGSKGIMVYSNSTGTSWSKIDGGTGTGKSQFDTASYSRINAMAYGGGKFVAVGSIQSDLMIPATNGQLAVSE